MIEENSQILSIYAIYTQFIIFTRKIEFPASLHKFLFNLNRNYTILICAAFFILEHFKQVLFAFSTLQN